MARPSDVDRFRRMIALLPYFKRGSHFNVSQIADALGTSRSQILADLERLSMCGVPPYTSDVLIEIDYDDWDEPSAFDIPAEPPALGAHIRFTRPELLALIAALQACGLGVGEPLVARLNEAASVDVDSTSLADTVRAAVGDDGEGAAFGAVARAIESYAVLDIEYFTAARGTSSCRRIHPWVLENHRGHWYLSAFCESAGEQRVFRMDRIRSAVATGVSFVPPVDPARPEPDLTGRTDLETATIRFAPGAAVPDAREWPGIEVVDTAADGAVTVTVPFDGVGWLARRVASRLGAATVVAPEVLRTAVIETATEIRAEAEN